MLPTIVFDDKKCDDPLSCRKCLLVCPSHVLGVGTKVGPKKYQEIDRHFFIVAGVRFDRCTGCMECVEICPKGALKVNFPVEVK
ncbi:MAG: 4Fe-4S dicluster domain-containing protein [Chloroflexi bacterium]|nr:4Fe-4S dicluster domain-containing protein [Chloroflexota bacterium]MBM3175134.1 4Fe-4S dicluster domain-containing protein [Chloroflexota bacterium]MBM4450884.1 4Fe-4S dicluster domain-containing protein [Chloroflexota bacterium]